MQPTCDVCGASATHLVRDIRRTTKRGDTWETYAPRGAVRHGCDAHPVYAVMYDLDDRILGRLTDDQHRPFPVDLLPPKTDF